MPIRKVLKEVGVSVGSWYDKREKKSDKVKRGPKPKVPDEIVLAEAKEYLKDPIFFNEGYKKLKVRLEEERGIKVGKERLRKILNEANLLLGQRNRQRVSPYQHTGIIKTTEPNKMWGTDIKEFYLSFGKVFLFSVIDHCYGNIAGHYVSSKKTAIAATEAVRNAVKKEFKDLTKEICKGPQLVLRTDNGSQYYSKTFRKEAEYLGLTTSFTMVKSPESNGIIERFHKTVNEQLGSLNRTKDFDEAQIILNEFIERFNQKWLYHKNKLMRIEQIAIQSQMGA